MKENYKRVYISSTFARLLSYIVKYRKLRGKANAKLTTEQLILAYAKQLVSGMPEVVWRANMLVLINECESEHQEEYRREVAQYKATQKKAAQSLGDNQAILRRTPKQKSYKGKNEKNHG